MFERIRITCHRDVVRFIQAFFGCCFMSVCSLWSLWFFYSFIDTCVRSFTCLYLIIGEPRLRSLSTLYLLPPYTVYILYVHRSSSSFSCGHCHFCIIDRSQTIAFANTFALCRLPRSGYDDGDERSVAVPQQDKRRD